METWLFPPDAARLALKSFSLRSIRNYDTVSCPIIPAFSFTIVYLPMMKTACTKSSFHIL